VIAPDQGFGLGPVPQREAGTAGGALITAQRIGAAIGIAVIGTALFGSGGRSGGTVTPRFAPTRSLHRTPEPGRDAARFMRTGTGSTGSVGP
jgi:hypothetical protein